MQRVRVEVITTELDKAFEELMTTNPGMSKKVRKVISDVLRKARTAVSRDTKSTLSNDPRRAYMAVKRTVYRSIFGGSVSILSKRRTSNTRVRIENRRTLRPGQVGGNRRERSERTEMVDSYYGGDRGFILRFLNSGTDLRSTKYGRRGKIAARNWFGNSSQAAMERAAEEFTELIEKHIEQIMK